MAFSQDLTGEWRGTSTDIVHNFSEKVRLNFSKRKKKIDYFVKSYTPTRDSANRPFTLICHVIYKRLSEDSIYLAEDYIVSPHTPFLDRVCRQEMFLKISAHKGQLILSGVWKSYIDNCNAKGRIQFIKQ